MKGEKMADKKESKTKKTEGGEKTSSDKKTTSKAEEKSKTESRPDEQAANPENIEQQETGFDISSIENPSEELGKVHEEIAEVETQLRNLDTEISEMRKMVKPISKLDRKRGAVSQVTPEQRKIIRLKIKEDLNARVLGKAKLNELKGRFDLLFERVKRDMDTKGLKNRASSKPYVRRNRRFIEAKLEKMLQDASARKFEEMKEFKKLAENTSSKGKEQFRKSFGDFLSSFDEEAYVMCSSISDVKVELYFLIQNTLKAWKPSRNKRITELVYPV